MIDRTRFTLDLDSEGFPMPQAFGIAVHMIGQRYDGQVQGGLLADAKCSPCNPPGWQEVDGVKLPVIDWAEEHSDVPAEVKKVVAEVLLRGVPSPIVCENCCPKGECIAERVLTAGRAM